MQMNYGNFPIYQFTRSICVVKIFGINSRKLQKHVDMHCHLLDPFMVLVSVLLYLFVSTQSDPSRFVPAFVS